MRCKLNIFFFFKQKTAYEIRKGDWSSDVCSSDLFANKPIASHQLVQDKLAWMITEISKGQLLALHVGKLKDAGRADHTHISMLKMNNVAIALETARKARDILGANGIVDDYCIMRHMNNLESVYTYEGTNDIHKLVIGERITGISAFV